MKAYKLMTIDGSYFNARNVYFNETDFPFRSIPKSNEDIMDNSNLISFLKNYSIPNQISDEIHDSNTTPISDVVDNINPLLDSEREKRIQNIINTNDNIDSTLDSDDDEFNSDNVINDDIITTNTDRSLDDVIYDEIAEQNRSQVSQESSTVTGNNVSRKSSRNRVLSSLGLESIANSPIRRSRNVSIPMSESYEEMARLALNDDMNDKLNEFNVIQNSMEVREMIGKRIELLSIIHDHENALATRVHNSDIPKTRRQMLKHKDNSSYTLAEKNELDSFNRLNVLELVDRPIDKNVMKSGWVYDKKIDLHGNLIHKARLVAKGYSQVHGLDFFEVFSPTMQTKTFRTLLALASNDSNVMTESWDVSTAFLYADMDEEVYVEQPDGYVKHGKHKVYRMNKSMYGTKQASRNWNRTVSNALTSLGFKQSINDTCLYTLNYSDGRFVRLLVHVDDFAVFHNDSVLCKSVFNKLNKTFKLKCGPLSFFLGMRVCHYLDGSYSLDQENYALSILKRFNMFDSKSVVSPECASVRLSSADCPVSYDDRVLMKDKPYSALAGCLQYLVVGTRLDLAHAASQVSRFMQNPGKKHWNACLRILRYLKGTYKFRLWYCGDGVSLSAYCDADYAGCIDTRRSTSGYIVKIGSTAVCWQSKRQGCIALSSCESEYVSACTCSKQVVWMRRLLSELNVHINTPTTIYCDNDAARQLSENPLHHDRTKHIDTQFHYLRTLFTNTIIKLIHISTIDEEADILTKEYVGPRFMMLRDRAMGRVARRAQLKAQNTKNRS